MADVSKLMQDAVSDVSVHHFVKHVLSEAHCLVTVLCPDFDHFAVVMQCGFEEGQLCAFS